MGKKQFGQLIDFAEVGNNFQGKQLTFKPPASNLSVSVSEYKHMPFVHFHKKKNQISLTASEYLTLVRMGHKRIEEDIHAAFESIKKKGYIPIEEQSDQLNSISIEQCVSLSHPEEKSKQTKKAPKKKRKIVEPVEDVSVADVIPKKKSKKKTQASELDKIIEQSHKEDEECLYQDEDEESDEET